MDDTIFDHAFATREALASLRQIEPALSVWSPDELVSRHSVVLEEMHQEVLAGRVTIDAARAQRFQRLLESASGGRATPGRAPELAQRYREEYERAWRPVPGATEVLAALKSAGIVIGIVTNNLHAEQEFKLRRCDSDRHVDELIASSEVGITKPDPEIFRIALDRIGIAPDEAAMVGDVWDTDIAGAQAAGVRPVWFNWRGLPPRAASVVELSSLLPTDVAVRVIVSSADHEAVKK